MPFSVQDLSGNAIQNSMQLQIQLQNSQLNPLRRAPVVNNTLNRNQAAMGIAAAAMQYRARDPSGAIRMGNLPLRQQNVPVSSTGSRTVTASAYTLSSAQQDYRINYPIPVLSYPYKAVYIDYYDVDWGSSYNTVTQAVDQGFNIIYLAFYLSTSGAVDMALEWQQLNDQNTSYQFNAMQYAHQHNAVVLVSCGGATDYPMSTYPNLTGDNSAETFGTNVANWVLQNNLDGVDFDLENFGTGFTYSPNGWDGYTCVQWCVNANIACHNILATLDQYTDVYGGKKGAYISCVPQCPYLSPIGSDPQIYWAGSCGGYVGVYNNSVVNGQYIIDIVCIQFYNQGDNNYNSFDSCFTVSNSDFPGSALEQVSGLSASQPTPSYNSTGTIPHTKMVFGQLLSSNLGGSGYLSTSQINSILYNANVLYGYPNNVMAWFFSNTTVPVSSGGTGITSGTWLTQCLAGVPPPP